MVLVDKAAPHGLGPLVRGLLPEYPNLTVETEAHRLFSAEKGQLVVFVPNIEEAATLNFNRPVLSKLELRVVLYCDAATSGRLAHAAPDFYHWISHWIEGPSGPPPEAVARLRRAAMARPEAIVWAGDLEGLQAAFAIALPGRLLEVISVKKSLDDLIVAASPGPRKWIVWTDIDDPARLLIAHFASKAARRRGRSLILPVPSLTGLFDGLLWSNRIDATVLSLSEAIKRLETHGAEQPGRLAALAELSRASIEKIERLLAAEGHNASGVENRLASTPRPWTVLDELLRIQPEPEPDERIAEHPHEESDDASLALNLLDLARQLEQQGMFAEAEPLVREGLGLYEGLFGIDDPRTRDAVRQLTHLLKARGRYGEAILEWLRVLPSASPDDAKPGPRHPEKHWLHARDVEAANELLFMVSGLRHRGLAERALEAVRQALGDDAQATKRLAQIVETCPSE